MILLYLSILGFLSVFFFITWVARALTHGNTAVITRLEQVTKTQPDLPPAAEAGSRGYASPTLLLVRALARLVPLKGLGRRLENDLVRADIPLKGEEFAAFVILAFVAAALLGLLVFGSVLNACLLAAPAAAAPVFYLRMAKARRLAAFNSQLCDALAMIANTLRAGFSFLQALEMVRKELPDPISKEFGRALQDLNLGVSVEDALQSMVERVKSDDLDLMVTAVIIQRQIGGNLAEILDKIAETIRERVRIKGEIKILTAQGRISGLVVGLLPIGLLMVLLLINPGYMQDLFNNPMGIKLLAFAAVSEAIGLAAVKRIMNIEV
ncbi:MAG: type II secretion system F family protein [Bacillota bacterium]|uniref:type II secretion system F family protein n=1 Tax=Desulforudis sp. DRI-14 TaxID=3459793 RepID=UPI00349571FC